MMLPFFIKKPLVFLSKNFRRLLFNADKERLKSIVEGRMMRLAVEVTNICNANCSFCVYGHMKRPKRIMSNEQFERCIAWYSDYGGGELSFTPIVGDPLVDKNLIDKIRTARKMEKIKYIYIYTNLIGLGNFNTKDFLLSGINKMDISTCIGSREMYRRIFGVDKYDVVMSNLKSLLEENRKLGNKVKIDISLRCEKPYALVRSSSDYKEIVKLYGRHPGILDNEYDNWTGVIDTKDLPKGQLFKKIKKMPEPCSLFYKGLIVLANGDVGACWCRDFETQLVVGNINNGSLSDVWNGKKLKELRENWKRGVIPDICTRCLQYTPLSEFLTRDRKSILNIP